MNNNFRKSLFRNLSGISVLMIVGAVCFSANNYTSPSNSGNDIKQPNIIVILADDLGYGDLGGYFGGKAKTPNIDRLAQQGMLFTDFHSNGPMCSPTRASLLTGRYPQRLGIEQALSTDWEDKGIASDENKDEKTMAEYLKEEGYRTAIFGKWHLGKNSLANPIHHGFDEFRGLTCGSGDYFSKMDRNGYPDWWHNDKRSFQEGYATKVITDNSIRFIKSNTGNPFFLYVAYSAIHFPWQTAEDYNLETIREGEDYTSVKPGPKSKLGPHKPAEVSKVLLKMIEELDDGIGKIMKAVYDEKLENNTLVFFTSDNGGYLHYDGKTWPQVGSNGPLKGQKGQLYEGGHRVPAVAWYPGLIPALSVCDEPVMSFDLLPTFLDILEISFPAKKKSNAFDGVSLLPLFQGGNLEKGRTLFWRMSSQKAVRDGEWKLVIRDQDNLPELYNLKQDVGEQNNLVSQYPEKVRRLKAKLEAWERDVNIKFKKINRK